MLFNFIQVSFLTLKMILTTLWVKMKWRRWGIIFVLFVLAYASGFIPMQVGERLLRHTTPSVEASGEGETGVSQIKEIEVGVKEVNLANQNKDNEGQEWGKAKQVGKRTMRVGEDATKMGTAQEVLAALNAYRQKHGKGTVSWDQKLAEYAQSRAAYFTSKGDLDNHAGFSDYINNQDGFKKLGFMSLGENSSYGYKLNAVHLIEQIYAGDKPHDDNQLNSEWTHVGIGIDGTATDLVFGGRKF